jgi:hypothetical protein
VGGGAIGLNSIERVAPRLVQQMPCSRRGWQARGRQAAFASLQGYPARCCCPESGGGGFKRGIPEPISSHSGDSISARSTPEPPHKYPLSRSLSCCTACPGPENLPEKAGFPGHSFGSNPYHRYKGRFWWCVVSVATPVFSSTATGELDKNAGAPLLARVFAHRQCLWKLSLHSHFGNGMRRSRCGATLETLG